MPRVQEHGTFDGQLVDLKDVNLPLLSEPHHPRLKKYQQETTKAWSAIVDASDAFVFVTPEYNYTIAPALVNALDHLYHEWSYKACAFVSYGGISGGMRAVQTAKLMATGFKMVPIVEAVNIPFYTQLMEDGVFKGNDTHEKAVTVMLNELLRWTDALKPLRT
jgi:NAD(P)H-dependent FMN reductase